MPTAEEFDEFYLAARRRLLAQAYALTGDLGASQRAVRDAFVAARHHWDKVGRTADPEVWVRPRALSTAQRRHSVRRWHRQRGLDDEQRAVLTALTELSGPARHALVLSLVGGLGHPEIGRELGWPQARVVTALEQATQRLADRLGTTPADVPAWLAVLEPLTAQVSLPRAGTVRRRGVQRRRLVAVAGSVGAGVLAVTAGGFVTTSGSEGPPLRADRLVKQAMLLGAPTLAPLAPKRPWRVVSTDDNTVGDGLNTTCQGSAFADDAGLGTLVREFRAGGTPARRAVQTVEISATDGAARDAYRTVIGWYAGCTVARLQLVDSYRLTGVGDEAVVLRMRIPGKSPRSIVAGVARTGSLTVSTVLESAAITPVAASAVQNVLGSGVRRLCGSAAAGSCVENPKLSATAPPRSGETPGMLAVVDLPAVPGINFPWVGTDATAATTNPAATTCDRADFAKAKPVNSQTRTFVIPQGDLPQRFGLSETIARFDRPKAAADFADRLIRLVRSCPQRQLGSTLSNGLVISSKSLGGTIARWRLESQVNRREEKIVYWTAILRVGADVAQVTLTPVGTFDVTPEVWQNVVSRARERLLELS